MVRKLSNIPVYLWIALNSSIQRGLQNISTALIQIGANTGRSILTTLGIIIAVMSTITVIAIVQGFGQFMTEKVRGLGSHNAHV